MTVTVRTKAACGVCSGDYFSTQRPLIDWIRMGRPKWGGGDAGGGSSGGFNWNIYADAYGYLANVPSGAPYSYRKLMDQLGGNGSTWMDHRLGTFYLRYPAAWAGGGGFVDVIGTGCTEGPALGSGLLTSTAGLYVFHTTIVNPDMTLRCYNQSGGVLSMPKGTVSCHRAEHDSLVYGGGALLAAGVREIWNPDFLSYVQDMEIVRTQAMCGVIAAAGFGPIPDGGSISPIHSTMQFATDVLDPEHIDVFSFDNDGSNPLTDVKLMSPYLLGDLFRRADVEGWMCWPVTAFGPLGETTQLQLYINAFVAGLAGHTRPTHNELQNENFNRAYTYLPGRLRLLTYGANRAAASNPIICAQRASNGTGQVTWASADEEEKVAGAQCDLSVKLWTLLETALGRDRCIRTLGAQSGNYEVTGSTLKNYIDPTSGQAMKTYADEFAIAPYYYLGPVIISGVTQEHAWTDAVAAAPVRYATPDDYPDANWLAACKDAIDYFAREVLYWFTQLQADGISHKLTMYEGGMAQENQLYYWPGPDWTVDAVHNCMTSSETLDQGSGAAAYPARLTLRDGDQLNNFSCISHQNSTNPVDGTSGGAYLIKFASGSDTRIQLYTADVTNEANRVTILARAGTFKTCNQTRYDAFEQLNGNKMQRAVQADVAKYYFTKALRGRVRNYMNFTLIGQWLPNQKYGVNLTQDRARIPIQTFLATIKNKGVGTGIPV